MISRSIAIFIAFTCISGHAASLEKFLGPSQTCTYIYETEMGPELERIMIPDPDTGSVTVKERFDLSDLIKAPIGYVQSNLAIENGFLVLKSKNRVFKLLPKNFDDPSLVWQNTYQSGLPEDATVEIFEPEGKTDDAPVYIERSGITYVDATCRINDVSIEHIFLEDRQIVDVICQSQGNQTAIHENFKFASGIGQIEESFSIRGDYGEDQTTYKLTKITCEEE